MVYATSREAGVSVPIHDPLRPLDERDGPLQFRSCYPQRGRLKLWVRKNALRGYAIRAEIRYRVVSAPHVLYDQCCDLYPLLHDTVRSRFSGASRSPLSEPKQSAE